MRSLYERAPGMCDGLKWVKENQKKKKTPCTVERTCKAFAADLFAHTRCTSHTHFHSAVLFKSELVVFVFLFQEC